MRPKTWKVLDLGPVPEDAARHKMACLNCGVEALLPVVGIPIGQFGDKGAAGGLVFDIGQHAVPQTIKCRSCGKVFSTEDE